MCVIASQIAAQMSLGFVNDGVTVKLTNTYLAGSAVQQLNRFAQAGNFNYVTNGGSAGQILEIWPKGQCSRRGRAADRIEDGAGELPEILRRWGDGEGALRARHGPWDAFTLKPRSSRPWGRGSCSRSTTNWSA